MTSLSAELRIRAEEKPRCCYLTSSSVDIPLSIPLGQVSQLFQIDNYGELIAVSIYNNSSLDLFSISDQQVYLCLTPHVTRK